MASRRTKSISPGATGIAAKTRSVPTGDLRRQAHLDLLRFTKHKKPFNIAAFHDNFLMARYCLILLYFKVVY